MVCICCSYSKYATRIIRHIFEGNNITTQPRWPVCSYRHLACGFRRPAARPPPLGLPQLAEWTPPAPCACAPLDAVGSSIAVGWVSNTNTQNTAFRPLRSKLVTFWAVWLFFMVPRSRSPIFLIFVSPHKDQHADLRF